MFYKDLPREIQHKILSYIIYVREISEASEEEVRNLFRRMNKNVVPLNAQELRHATFSGDFINLMEESAEDEFWAENKIVTPNEIRRMMDVQFISDLYISMLNGIQDKTKDMDKYYQLYQNETINKSELRNNFYDLINVIKKLLPEIKETRWKNKSDFYTLFMVLNEIKKKQKEIEGKHFKDVKKDLLKFSEEVMKMTKKEGKGSNAKKEIVEYANAVTKSTTDKDRRLLRHKILYSRIAKFF